MGKSLYLGGVVLDYILGNPSFLATVYVAVYVGAVEVSGNNYSRVSVTNDGSHWSAASGTPRRKTNLIDVNFPTPSGSWGTPTVVAIVDASTSGNVLWSDLIDTPVPIPSGATFNFLAGDLKVRES